jgi:hypothetical protein
MVLEILQQIFEEACTAAMHSSCATTVRGANRCCLLMSCHVESRWCKALNALLPACFVQMSTVRRNPTYGEPPEACPPTPA